MAKPARRAHSLWTVVYDVDAVIDFEDVKGKADRKALFNVVDKLQRLGPQLAPPHVKTLKDATDLQELRPRQGHSAVRVLCRRSGNSYVILAVARKSDFDKKVRLAEERAKRYE